MYKQLLTQTNFYQQYGIFENGVLIALVKISPENTPYQVDMMEKSPSYLIAVFDYLRAEWRSLWNSILD